MVRFLSEKEVTCELLELNRLQTRLLASVRLWDRVGSCDGEMFLDILKVVQAKKLRKCTVTVRETLVDPAEFEALLLLLPTRCPDDM